MENILLYVKAPGLHVLMVSRCLIQTIMVDNETTKEGLEV